MSEHESKKPGVADRTFGAADDDQNAQHELSESPTVHGAEGGGDPAAGAEEDAADPEEPDVPR